MRKFFKRFDRSIYKYNPDQMIVRLNEMISFLNSVGEGLELTDTNTNSNEVIVLGKQPDGSFGIVKYAKRRG